MTFKLYVHKVIYLIAVIKTPLTGKMLSNIFIQFIFYKRNTLFLHFLYFTLVRWVWKNQIKYTMNKYTVFQPCLFSICAKAY